ncbi:hypothetical protein HanPI659440_Chr03g0097551 [Helianthus annuus]|nr:hypothetical protein HanPI659440_Chr03g0097551 [Helianthus annuus]
MHCQFLPTNSWISKKASVNEGHNPRFCMIVILQYHFHIIYKFSKKETSNMEKQLSVTLTWQVLVPWPSDREEPNTLRASGFPSQYCANCIASSSKPSIGILHPKA